MSPRKFKGDEKAKRSMVWPIEKRLINFLAPLVPSWLQTYHLTMMTVLWSAVVVLSCWLGKNDIRWLWGASAAILLQYITDILDGEIGRRRDTGLIKWGYYMDHMLDYVFAGTIVIGYTLIIPETYMTIIVAGFVMFTAFMVHAYLYFATTNDMIIGYVGFGPTEIRFLLIANNTLMIYLGATYMMSFLPYVLGVALIAFIVSIYRAHKRIWKLDMERKRRNA